MSRNILLEGVIKKYLLGINRIIRENKTTPELSLRKRFLELIQNMTKICGYSKDIIINEPRRESYGTPDVK
jgi:hypothetical protein